MDSETHTTQLPSISAAETDSHSPVNATDEDHTMKQATQFYFVKLHPYENPNLLKLEGLVRKLAQDCIDAKQKRQEKLAYRHKLHWSLGGIHYRGSEWEWHGRKLELLQLSLEKLTFTNNCSRGRAIKPSSTVKEIDHHSLHFGLLHVSKSVAGERRILSKIKEVEKISRYSCISMEDYNDNICRLWRETYREFDMKDDEKKQILQEIKILEWTKEEAIAIAALGGKMWNSLGPKENIKQQIKSIVDDKDRRRAEHLKYNAKVIFLKEELMKVEDDLTSLEKRMTNLGRLICEARAWISQWRTEEDEKNASYNQYIKLMRNAQEHAERKELASLQKLSQEQVEKFMFQWSDDKALRDDYTTRRVVPSLNNRCLTIDGRRRRNWNEKPIFVKDQDVNMSKALKKALQKHQKENFG